MTMSTQTLCDWFFYHMPSTKQNDSAAAEFVLKHRIAGAAFLLLFGAFLLPWLLGPHSSLNAKSTESEGHASKPSLDASFEKSVADLQATSALTDVAVNANPSSVNPNPDSISVSVDPGSDDDDYVYISRITPLDKSGSGAKGNTATIKESISSPKPKASVNQDNSVEQKSAEKKSIEKVAVTEPKKEKSLQVEPKPQVAEKPPVAKPVKSESADSKIDNNKVDSGWIVSVGVYSQTKNADAIYSELVKNKFSPSSSVISTSKGKATRVWLGPYADKSRANNIKNQLKSVTGEPGLIKAYP